jgi:hypothetical protein
VVLSLAVKRQSDKNLYEDEWIWLIGLKQRVNHLLHDKLIKNQDGICWFVWVGGELLFIVFQSNKCKAIKKIMLMFRPT